MNRHFLTVLMTVVLTASNAQAQFTFGVRTGVNCSKIWGGSETATNMKLGFQVGAIANYFVNNNFSLEPGFFVAMMGHRIDVAAATRTESPVYFQIPVHVRYNLSDRFFVRAGPYFGFFFTGYGKWDTDEHNYKLNFGREDVFGQRVYRSFDFGLSAGAGMQFGNIQVGLEGKQGLTDVIHSSSYKNLAISLTATYMFGKKRKNTDKG